MPIGKEPDEIDAESPAEHDVAVALGFESFDADCDEQDDEFLSCAEMWKVIQQQGRTIDRLEERVDDLQQEQNRAERNRKKIAARLNDVDESIEETDEEIAKTANANANQAKSIAETGGTAPEREDTEELPGGVNPSISPLDFLAN